MGVGGFVWRESGVPQPHSSQVQSRRSRVSNNAWELENRL